MCHPDPSSASSLGSIARQILEKEGKTFNFRWHWLWGSWLCCLNSIGWGHFMYRKWQKHGVSLLVPSVVRLAEIGNPDILFLSKCEQIWRIKKRYCIPKPSKTHTLCLIMSHLIAWQVRLKVKSVKCFRRIWKECKVDVRRSQMLQRDPYHVMNDFEDVLMCSPTWPSRF